MTELPQGIYTALATPFFEGKVDFESLSRLVERQLEMGVLGFVVNGTTGESPTLEISEVTEIFKFVQNLCPRETPLILGCGGNSTQKVAALSKKLEPLHPTAFLSVVPYYNKPTPQGLREHFQFLAQASSIPLLLYNVPGRVQVSFDLETLKALSETKGILGVKEASGDIGFAKEISSSLGSGFRLLSGDDGSFFRFLEAGGQGLIGVASHLLGDLYVQAYENFLSGKGFDEEAWSPYRELIELLYVESNPIPIKYALYKQGLFRSPELRLPMTSLSKSNQLRIDECLLKAGLL